MEMTDSLVIPSDSTLKIASEGLLGGNFLTIEVGGSDEQLQSGDEFEYTQGAVDLMSLIGQAVFSGKQ
jgi:ABC-type transport system involved in resistance to organic solvents, periplasmic component